MLSGAKHLQYRLGNEQMQILRFAQDDIPGILSAACCWMGETRREAAGGE
jgi:hypothetical protein